MPRSPRKSGTPSASTGIRSGKIVVSSQPPVLSKSRSVCPMPLCPAGPLQCFHRDEFDPRNVYYLCRPQIDCRVYFLNRFARFGIMKRGIGMGSRMQTERNRTEIDRRTLALSGDAGELKRRISGPDRELRRDRVRDVVKGSGLRIIARKQDSPP